MPTSPPAESVGPVLAALHRLTERCRAVEDDVLAGLVVLGEPVPQRTLDDWLDQAADTLRALGDEASTQHRRLTAASSRAETPSPEVPRRTR